MRDVADALGRAGIDAASLHLMRRTDAGDVLAVRVPGHEAESTWRRLRDASGQVGHWPVMCPIERLELYGQDRSVAATLAAADGIDVRPGSPHGPRSARPRRTQSRRRTGTGRPTPARSKASNRRPHG